MIIGTAAATLTGLMFVVTTLLAGIDRRIPTMNAGISAFNTPTIVHFCAVLVMSGILSAPWQELSSVSILIGFMGLGGVIYLIVVARRMRHVPQHPTPMKDWLWYLLFPFLPYLLFVVAAFALTANPVLVLYGISGTMLVLLMIGIHNAWDLVVYLATERYHPENTPRK